MLRDLVQEVVRQPAQLRAHAEARVPPHRKGNASAHVRGAVCLGDRRERRLAAGVGSDALAAAGLLLRCCGLGLRQQRAKVERPREEVALLLCIRRRRLAQRLLLLLESGGGATQLVVDRLAERRAPPVCSRRRQAQRASAQVEGQAVECDCSIMGECVVAEERALLLRVAEHTIQLEDLGLSHRLALARFEHEVDGLLQLLGILGHVERKDSDAVGVLRANGTRRGRVLRATSVRRGAI